MSSFRVPGAELATSFSDQHGHPVVQLHGLTSSRERDRMIDLDLGRGLSGTRLLRYDARGHGESTGRTVPEDYTWPRLAEDLLALLDDHFPGEAVHGAGPSMGCATLLHAAVRDPGRFSSLTLLIPSTAWETRVAQAENYERLADFVEQHGMERFLAASRDVHRPPAQIGTPDTLPQVREELLPSVYRGAALSDLPSPEAIARIDVPVTILAWTDDPGHPVSTAERLHELLPQSSLQIASTRAEVAGWPAVLAADVARAAG